MSFCFSFHIHLCSSVFSLLLFHILKKTDNSVPTIDDFCVEIDLLDFGSRCGVTFKLNLIGPGPKTTCPVVREFDCMPSKGKDRMIDILDGAQCHAAQLLISNGYREKKKL